MVRPSAEANRKNVAKFYDSNKDDIQKRAVLKRLEEGKAVRKATLDKYGIEQEAPKKKPAKRGGYTINQLDMHYQNRVDNPDIQMAQRTADDYIRNMKRILVDTGCSPDIDLLDCLNKGIVLDHILKQYPNPNTRKTYLQVFLYAIDNTPKLKDNVKNRDRYFNAWEKAKEEATGHQIQKQVDGAVERFSTIKKRIEKEFNKYSQEVLLINLYDQLTMRNDFGEILLFDKTPTPPMKTDNYLVFSTGRLFMNNFNKTGNKYKPVNLKLTKDFMKMARKSLKQDPRVFLFEDTAKLFKNMKTGVNELRHAKISEELAGDNIKDPEKRKELYDKMKHSPATQLNYIRKIV
tara:strand:+ start:902 stop:1945 length:1044 start_codon:yes stop_codon:yes gene_type:complete